MLLSGALILVCSCRGIVPEFLGAGLGSGSPYSLPTLSWGASYYALQPSTSKPQHALNADTHGVPVESNAGGADPTSKARRRACPRKTIDN